jgi:hypothetical protein
MSQSYLIKSCEKLNRDIEYIVGAVVSGFVLLGKKVDPEWGEFPPGDCRTFQDA